MDLPHPRRLTVGDGFRLGLGFALAQLLLAVIAIGALLEKGMLPESVARWFAPDAVASTVR